ncbi:hypothetical protein CRX67_24715 [Enterobacteriaceae bacterium A-F18]|nr:hypothetical protein CRX67_24715 [Enterobacteriaceae bacterium A-F18]
MKTAPSPNGKCASYFALVARWLRFLTPVTYFCMLPGMRKLAALLGLSPRPFGASASAVQKR